MAQMPMLNNVAFVYQDLPMGMDGDFALVDDQNPMPQMAEQDGYLQTPLDLDNGFNLDDTFLLGSGYPVDGNLLSPLSAPAGNLWNLPAQATSSPPMPSPGTSQGPSLAGSPFYLPPIPLHDGLANNQTPQALMPVAPDAWNASINPVMEAPVLSAYGASPQVMQATVQQESAFDITAVCVRSCALLEQDPSRSAVRRELCDHLRDREGYQCTLVGKDATNQAIDKYLAGDIKGAHKTYGRQAKKSFSQKNIRAAKKIRKQTKSQT